MQLIQSFAIALVFLSSLSAQSPLAVTGRVQDQMLAPIPGACVEILSNGRSLATTTTGAEGEFTVAVPPGAYTIRLASSGFEDLRQPLNVVPGLPPVVFTLQVAARAESVTVTEMAGFQVSATSSATRTDTPIINVPQSISIVTKDLVRDQMMMSVGDVVRYVPGITAAQGEGNRDQLVIRGNDTTADFFLNGLRDDVQYFRDLYNLERLEALKGPNAMIFGRGGGGGVINRVSKQAGFTPLREINVQGGSFNMKRVAADFDQPLTDRLALRLNAVYEDSAAYRHFSNLDRYGFNPTLTFHPNTLTRLTISYENFHDKRIADRGTPSFNGRPLNLHPSTYFGDPNNSPVRAAVNLGAVGFERQLGRLNLRNRTLIGDYDRFYSNYVPGAVNPAQTLYSVSAYDNATHRRNLFNQTDLTTHAQTAFLRHTLLTGAEFGRQQTTNFRRTGFFNNSATSLQIPLLNPTVSAPITFRQNATDADNFVRNNVAAIYLQDQIELSRFFQIVAGIRADRFDIHFLNQRTSERLRRLDHLLSPRAGVIFKPAAAVSLYTNYSVSYLPSAGDQFAALTSVTQQVKPEKFTNLEAGLKWDLSRTLTFTAALYRLDRTNTRSLDPNDPTRILQTGSQRSNGFELGFNGNILRKWSVAGGYAYQDAFISAATVSARAGARVGQVPHHSFSFWNQGQLTNRLSAGIGLLNRSDMFAAFDNTVTLPGYTRADAALHYSLSERLRLQANLENLTNRRYTLNAHTNTNITPGAPRTLRLGLIFRF